MGARFTTTSRPGTSQCVRPVEGSRALRDTAPSMLCGPLSSPDGLRPGKLEGPREARTHLLPHSWTTTTPLTTGRAVLLTVARVREGPAVTPTNGQAAPANAVAH